MRRREYLKGLGSLALPLPSAAAAQTGADAVLEDIMRVPSRRVINIEPATGMLSRLDPQDIASCVYIRSMD